MGRGMRQRLNQAVRTHCPGGSRTLDALNLFEHICNRQDPDSEAGKIAKTALTALDGIANEMRDQALIWLKEKKEKDQHP